jgi:hypothetical protein
LKISEYLKNITKRNIKKSSITFSVFISECINKISISDVKLNDSFILKEIWRQLNGFPPVLEPIRDELNRMLVESKEKEDQEKTK